MSDIREKKLVVAVVQYLRNKILSGQLGPDQSESLEVAIQCLENGFNVDSLDLTLQSEADLLSLFTAAPSEKREPTQQEKDEAERLKNVGNDLMKDGKYDEAVTSYTAAINLFRSPIFYCNRAAAYSKLERHQNAVDDCKTALQLDPTYSKAYGRMGLAYSCMNRYQEARDSYKKALELEPTNDSFRNNLKIAEDKLEETARQQRAPGAANNPFGVPGGFNPLELLNNMPGLVQMAQQFMNDPNMQNMMNSMMGMGMGGGGSSAGEPTGQQPPPPSAESRTPPPEQPPNANQSQQQTPPQPPPQPGLNQLLEMGQRLAAQMQAQNPELVEQLRQQFQQQHGPPSSDGGNNRNESDQNPPPQPPPS